jgi:hypothetical protein
MKKMNEKLINKKVIAGAIAIAALILVYIILILNGITFSGKDELTPKANFTVLAAGDIPTPDLNLLTITSTVTTSPSQIIDGIAPQKFVKIQGTGGSGLRIRNNPGTNSNVNFIANESEVFLVIGGPQEVDNILWWQLAAPYDDTRQGWAAAEYLEVIEE